MISTHSSPLLHLAGALVLYVAYSQASSIPVGESDQEANCNAGDIPVSCGFATFDNAISFTSSYFIPNGQTTGQTGCGFKVVSTAGTPMMGAATMEVQCLNTTSTS